MSLFPLILLGFAFGAPPIDLNQATATDLADLPGVGPFQAMVIVVSRETNGDYMSWEDVASLHDVGPGLLMALKVRTRLAPTPGPNIPRTITIPVNDATAETISAFPSISLATAQRIVSDREQQGPFADCADLSRIVGIGEPTIVAIQDLCRASG